MGTDIVGIVITLLLIAFNGYAAYRKKKREQTFSPDAENERKQSETVLEQEAFDWEEERQEAETAEPASAFENEYTAKREEKIAAGEESRDSVVRRKRDPEGEKDEEEEDPVSVGMEDLIDFLFAKEKRPDEPVPSGPEIARTERVPDPAGEAPVSGVSGRTPEIASVSFPDAEELSLQVDADICGSGQASPEPVSSGEHAVLPEEESWKRRLKRNPKDIILYTELLRPKYKDF